MSPNKLSKFINIDGKKSLTKYINNTLIKKETASKI